MDEGMREYLTALRDLLAEAPGWTAGQAHASLDSVLVGRLGRPQDDLEYETAYVRARLGEVERAKEQP